MSDAIQHHDTGDIQPGSLPVASVPPALSAGATIPYPNGGFSISHGRNRKHVVRVTFKYHNYAAVRDFEVDGNTLGFDVIQAAVEALCEEIASDLDNGGTFVLTEPDGSQNIFDADSILNAHNEVDDGQLMEHVVKAEIVSVEDTDDAWRAMHRKLDALNIAFDADAEATSTTPDADASANRGVQAGGEMMYPATQFAAMRERAEKAETKLRELHDRAERTFERNAELADCAEKAEAVLAERNKRIATLDGLLREGMGLDDRDRESGDWLDWFKRARAALEGKVEAIPQAVAYERKEAPRG